ncbi:MAG: hypothetical protein LBT61_02285 [Prevotellaceae bacterium]|jgi:hypothetical protein|nr:hypothetical protein [Prevotellaceae bacterium]
MSKKTITAKKTKPAAKSAKKITKPLNNKKVSAKPVKKVVAKKTVAAVKKTTKPVKKTIKPVKKTVVKTVAKAKKATPVKAKKVAAAKKPVKKTVAPVKKKVAPVKKTTKPAKPVAKALKPKSKQVKKPVKTAQKVTKPVQKPVKTVQKVTKPVQKPVKTAQKVTKPVPKPVSKKVTPAKTPEVAPVKKAPVQQGGKRRLVASYKNLAQGVLDAIKEKYPHGYNDYMADIMKVDKPDGTYFYAITIDLPDTIYLVKIDVKIDTDYEEVEREMFGGGPDNTGDDSSDFPDTGDDSSDFADDAEEDEE